MRVMMAPTTTRPPIVPPIMAGVLFDFEAFWVVAGKGVVPALTLGVVVFVVVFVDTMVSGLGFGSTYPEYVDWTVAVVASAAHPYSVIVVTLSLEYT
jgi:hypothetical protein